MKREGAEDITAVRNNRDVQKFATFLKHSPNEKAPEIQSPESLVSDKCTNAWLKTWFSVSYSPPLPYRRFSHHPIPDVRARLRSDSDSDSYTNILQTCSLYVIYPSAGKTRASIISNRTIIHSLNESLSTVRRRTGQITN